MFRLDCPSSKLQEGTKLNLTANTPAPKELMFLWAIGRGKILAGQGTPSITIDTTGLAGQTISVVVEVNYGFGLAATAKCDVQIREQTVTAVSAEK